MARRLDEIIADFDALKASDFANRKTGANGLERLEQLCDEMRADNDVAICAPTLLRTMERLDNDLLGCPGPLVHTIESWRGSYEKHLIESLRRMPTPLAVWMVNRILNTKPPDSETWLEVLRNAADHTTAAPATKAKALHFLKYHSKG